MGTCSTYTFRWLYSVCDTVQTLDHAKVAESLINISRNNKNPNYKISVEDAVILTRLLRDRIYQ